MKHVSIISLAMATFAFPVQAQSPILGLESVEVIKGWRQADGTHMAAVQIKLDKGWKTYWRVAGAGGVPPQFDWSASDNIASYAVHWPSPDVFNDYNQQTIGYKETLVLPISFTPKDKTQPMNIAGTIDFGVCEDVCVPVHSELKALLPPRVSVGKSTINAALNAVAQNGKAAGVKIVGCEFTPMKDGFKIQANLSAASEFTQAALGILEYPIGPEDWLQQKPSEANGKNLAVNAVLYASDIAFIDRSKIRVTVLQGGKAIEVNGCL